MCVQPCLPREFVSMHVSLFLSFSRRGTQHLRPTVCNEAMGASGKGRQTCLPVPASWEETWAMLSCSWYPHSGASGQYYLQLVATTN